MAGTILLGLSLGLIPAKASTTDDAAVNASTPKVDDTQTVGEIPATQPATVSLGKSNVETPAAPKAPAKPEKPVTAVQPEKPVSVDSTTDADDSTPEPPVTADNKQLAREAPVAADAAAPADTDTSTDTSKPANDTTTQSDYASATPITDNPKAVVPDGTQKLDGKYAFIPKFNGSGTTAVSVIGTEKAVTKKNTIAADLVNATKGQVGFKYTNIGFDAAGNSMDMNILYTDWGRLDQTDPAYVETYTTMIYSNFRGAGWGDVTYEFVRSDSGNPENVTGLMTLTDIDGNQTVSVTDSQWAGIDNLYIPKGDDPMSGQNDNWLRYTENDGYVTIVSPDSGNTPSDGQYSMLTFTYTNQSSLTFRYSDGTDGTVPTKLTAWGVNYIPQKPLATATVTPTITVSDSDETTVLRDTVKDGESTYTYNINQVIPDEWAQFYYGNVALTGTLPKNTSVTGFKVLDEVGNDVTQHFINESTGQTFKATVNADYLQSGDFYGHRYTIQLNMSVPQTDSVQQLSFNMATTIDGDTKASNSVTTLVDKKHYLVTHYYVQGTTTSVAPDQRQRVIYGSSYTTSAQTQDNYRLVGQIRTSGTFTDESQAAIYEYAPLTVSIPVKYVDQRGKEISPATSLTGRLDTGYDANNLKRDLTGYDLKSVENATGTYAENNAAIIFHYQAKTITIKIHDIDNYENNLDKELGLTRTIQGLYNDPYQLSVLDVPQWSEIYSGAKSLLSGTYSENQTITLRYKQAWNRNFDNYDGSETIPVFNGLDKFLGVMQVHPDKHEDVTTVLIKPKGKYLVGTLDDDTNVETFHQQAAVTKGKSVTITSNTGEKIRVSISKAGAITIAQLNSKTLPMADRATVNAKGNEIKQYIDTKSAVNGLKSTALSENGEYSFQKATQSWPNGYTTSYDSTNPAKVKITVRNAKGKIVYSKANFKLTKDAQVKVGKNRWIFKGNAHGALKAELVVANKAGNGKAYTQQLTFGGTLKWTSVATIRHHQITGVTMLTYGQYREQYYDDEPAASSAKSGHVIGTQKVTRTSKGQWKVASFTQQGQLIGSTIYQLHVRVKVASDFAELSASGQADWLSAHSNVVAHYNGNSRMINNNRSTEDNDTNNWDVQKDSTDSSQVTAHLGLPQTGDDQSSLMTGLGILGIIFSWLLGLGRMKQGERRDD